MGGHGGLNILPQKKWNVYNYDNRVKVEADKKKYKRIRKEQKEKIREEKAKRVFNTLRAQNDPFKNFEEKERESCQNPEHQKEMQMEQDRFIKQTTMYLGQTVLDSEKPWYTKPSNTSELPVYDFSNLQTQDFFSKVPEKSARKHPVDKKAKHMTHKKATSKLTIEELRKERLMRESEERKRAEKLLGEKGNSSKYNDTYSNYINK
jgi:hypothetical protein